MLHKKLIFINANDNDLDNAWWLYEEAHIKKDYFEMHILFHSQENKLRETIIGFEEIISTFTFNNFSKN